MSENTILKEEINFFDIKKMLIYNDRLGEEKLSKESSEKDKKEYRIKEDNNKKASKFIHKLLQQKENCTFLMGAGISKESGGPLMSDLWEYFTKESTLKEEFKKYIELLNYKNPSDNNLEEFLSRLIIYLNNSNNIDSENKEEILTFKNKIEKELKNKCLIEYKDESEFSYFLHYLNKVRGGANKSRLKFFTLNYDTLFEQTASKYGYTIIDGFSFSNPRKFDSNNFDLDIIEKKDNRVENNKLNENVFHLYKLHGSLNWKKQPNNDFHMVDINKGNIGENGEIIYPGKGKYEQSYNMPYFEMLTRFQFELRKKDTVLNIIGYGFGDEHIDRIIIEALKNNNGLTINIFFSNIYKEVDDTLEFNLNNIFIKSILSYIKMKKINIFNFRFWGIVNLLQVEKPDTLEEQLAGILNPELFAKFYKNENK